MEVDYREKFSKLIDKLQRQEAFYGELATKLVDRYPVLNAYNKGRLDQLNQARQDMRFILSRAEKATA